MRLLLVILMMALVGCSRSLPADPPSGGAVAVVGDLTVEEYPVVRATEDQPTRFEFKERIPEAVLAKRRAWREAERYDDLEARNRILAPFGYRLAATGGGFDLYRGDQLLLAGLTEVGRVSAGAADFALVVGSPGTGMMLVRKESVTPWDVQKHLYRPPIMAGESLIAVAVHYPEGHVLPGTPIPYTVTRDGVEVHRFTVPEQATRPGVERLTAWGDRWVVEIRGDVLVQGASLNKEHGYDESFGWQLLAGKPFYFFRHGKSYGMVYDGQVLPQQYEEIPHYRCCEPAMFNPSGNSSMVIYYGLRDGVWHYVEVGQYGEP